MEKIKSYKTKFQDIPGLEEFRNLQKELFSQAMSLKADVIEKVADMALGRPHTPEDAGRFEMCILPGKDYELIKFDGTAIGAIVLKQGDVNAVWTISWVFDPSITSF